MLTSVDTLRSDVNMLAAVHHSITLEVFETETNWVSATALFQMVRQRKAREAFVVRVTCDRHAFY